MSIPISLIQMPIIPMENIFEYLDFQSILILRKVCHDLRNFIDNAKPASRLTEIKVSMHAESISFELCFPRPPLVICIDYMKSRKKCLIKWKKHKKVGRKTTKKQKTVKHEDFVAVFCKDFDIILRHQKTVLEEFRVDFELSNSTDKKSMLECVNKSFKSLKYPLQVKLLCMTMNDMLTILSYIDPKLLEEIHIHESSKRDNYVLNLDEIGQLKQWKLARELWIDRVQISNLAGNLENFSKIVITFQKIPIEELILLKEIFLYSSTLTSMELYQMCNGAETYYKLIEEFGEPFLDTNQNANWFFSIPNTDQFFRIKFIMFRHGGIEFNRIEQSDVPQDARISN